MSLLSSLLLLTSLAHAGDRDDDGVSNRDDQCIDEPETRNGYRDDDGCPDELGQITVMILDLDGNAIGGAAVKLGSERATADASGTIVFADRTPQTTVSLGAAAEGYVTQELPDFEIGEGPYTEVMVLDWQPVPVTVAVYDAASREPLAANVRWDGPGHIPTERTDATSGAYTFDARPGPWHLRAEAEHYQVSELDIEVSRSDNPTHRLTLVPNWMQIESRWVPFAEGSDELTQEQKLALDELALDLFGFPDTAISVEGHADDDEDHLSARRAAAVSDALVAAGIPAERIARRDLGDSVPIDSPWTATGRARNRAVRITVPGLEAPVLVPFAEDATTPSGDVNVLLSPVLEALAGQPDARVDVVGSRDRSEGSLSLRRASAVAEHLLFRDVGSERLFAIGRRAVDDLDSGVTFRLRSGGETVDLPHQIYFEPDNNQVEAISVDPLREIARLTAKHPVMRVAVRGHAAGDDLQAAGQLASERASIVRRFLVDNGVDPQRLSVRGQPQEGSEDGEEGLALRYVDFVVLPPPLLSRERIVFDPGARALDATAQPVLRRVAEAMERYPVSVEVRGTAVAADNAPAEVLGRVRASLVADALVALGVDRSRLSMGGSASEADEGEVTFRVTTVDAQTELRFTSQSSELDAEARASLTAVLPTLLLTEAPVRVVGMASAADGRADLTELAESRAAAVAAYLEFSGVSSTRLRTTIRLDETGGPSSRRAEIRVGR